MNRTIYELYIMTLSLRQGGWKVYDLVVSKHTGGVFAQVVIDAKMMKDCTSIQRYMYEPEWMGGRAV